MDVAALFSDDNEQHSSALHSYSDAEVSHLFDGVFELKKQGDLPPSYSQAIQDSKVPVGSLSDLFKESEEEYDQGRLDDLFKDPERNDLSQGIAWVSDLFSDENSVPEIFQDDVEDEFDNSSVGDLFYDDQPVQPLAELFKDDDENSNVYTNDSLKEDLTSLFFEENHDHTSVAELFGDDHEKSIQLHESFANTNIFSEKEPGEVSHSGKSNERLSDLFSDDKPSTYVQNDSEHFLNNDHVNDDNAVYNLFQGEPSPSNSPQHSPLSSPRRSPDPDGIANFFVGEPDHDMIPRRGSMDLVGMNGLPSYAEAMKSRFTEPGFADRNRRT